MILILLSWSEGTVAAGEYLIGLIYLVTKMNIMIIAIILQN